MFGDATPEEIAAALKKGKEALSEAGIAVAPTEPPAAQGPDPDAILRFTPSSAGHILQDLAPKMQQAGLQWRLVDAVTPLRPDRSINQVVTELHILGDGATTVRLPKKTLEHPELAYSLDAVLHIGALWLAVTPRKWDADTKALADVVAAQFALPSDHPASLDAQYGDPRFVQIYPQFTRYLVESGRLHESALPRLASIKARGNVVLASEINDLTGYAVSLTHVAIRERIQRSIRADEMAAPVKHEEKPETPTGWITVKGKLVHQHQIGWDRIGRKPSMLDEQVTFNVLRPDDYADSIVAIASVGIFDPSEGDAVSITGLGYRDYYQGKPQVRIDDAHIARA